jgi:alpha-glucosidase
MSGLNDNLSTCLIGPGIARFRDPRSLKRPLRPFPGFVEQPTAIGPLPVGFPIRPRYSSRRGRSRIEFFNTRHASLYGTGEQAGPPLRNGTRKTLWNSDSYAYNDKTKSLYQSHPFILGVRAAHRRGAASVPAAFGIVIETTYRCTFDFRTGGNPFAEVDGPAPAATVIIHETPQEVVQTLARLTGFMPLPPLWALGYHQCRYSYESAQQVHEIAGGFRSQGIPCDTIWLDIDYMDGYRCFTFDKERFPDPASLAKDLHKQNFKLVAMIDPGLKVDDAYTAYLEGRDQDHFVKIGDCGLRIADSKTKPTPAPKPIPNPQSTIRNDFIGPVWPGPCAFPDFTRQRTRRWWGSLHADLLDIGIDGIWNDMNEPALFVPSKTMPNSNVHDADADLGGPGDHARYHNVYGMQMARATREGLEALRPQRRPFVLTRAGFLGSQRHAAAWTGDNVANWEHLRWTIPMVLNLSLSGQPFCGPDIGGFVGNTDPDLFARWIGIGALLPFCRAHKNKGTKMHEPWELGPDCEKACRLALERRYRLLPYLYTLFHEAARTGLPIARPVFFADHVDPRLRTVDDAFLLGGGLLVRASVSPTSPTPTSPMPRGRWIPFEITDGHAALPQLLLRAGSLIPMGPAIQHTGDGSGPIALLAALDERDQATGTLYEDAGDGPVGSDFSRTTFRVSGREGKIEVLSHAGGRPARRELQVIVL